MLLIINHVTRMKPGFICVAGIEPETGKHIRPVLCQGLLTRNLLRKEGGVFEIGALVDLGPTKDVGCAPEVEDREFCVANLRYKYKLKPDEFWKYVSTTAQNRAKSIFGEELQQRETSRTTEAGAGKASLGILKPARVWHIGVNDFESVRIYLSDGEVHPDLPVTDIRLYARDQKTARHEIVDCLERRLRRAAAVFAVGLSRPWKKDGADAPRHWLQVNNIHLEEDPLGALFEC